MSDPVTNVDVEDVLSSIRRLVSNTEEKLHPAPKREEVEQDVSSDDSPAPDDASEAAPATSALVLTSALRVADPATEADIPDDLDPDEGSAVLDNLRSALSLSQGSDEYEDESTDVDADSFQTSFSEDTPSEDTDIVDFSDTAEITEVQDWSHEAQSDETQSDEAQSHESADPEPDHHDHHDAHHDTHESSSESALEHAEESHDEDHGEQAQNDWSVDAETSEEDPQAEDHQTADDSDSWSDDSDDAEAETDVDHVEHHEPDAEQGAEFSSARSSSEVEAQAEAEAEQHHEHDDHDTSEDDTATVFDGDGDSDEDTLDLGNLEEAVIDEEMLRDLVAEIVRQELTGVLGERITRNVRKLVRREIHRAMLTREFD